LIHNIQTRWLMNELSNSRIKTGWWGDSDFTTWYVKLLRQLFVLLICVLWHVHGVLVYISPCPVLRSNALFYLVLLHLCLHIYCANRYYDWWHKTPMCIIISLALPCVQACIDRTAQNLLHCSIAWQNILEFMFVWLLENLHALQCEVGDTRLVRLDLPWLQASITRTPPNVLRSSIST
jgi:hypothetical protein